MRIVMRLQRGRESVDICFALNVRTVVGREVIRGVLVSAWKIPICAPFVRETEKVVQVLRMLTQPTAFERRYR